MGRNKKWDGYASWSYLEPETDYYKYPLEKQVDRVPRYDFGLSKAQEERVEEIVEKNVIISLHEHLNVFPAEPLPPRVRRRPFVGYEGLYSSGMDAVFDNCVCSTFDQVVDFLGMRQCDYDHQDFVIVAKKAEDITRAFKEGKVAVIQTIEQASAIDRDVDKIDLLFGLGVRSMGIVYSESNTLGSGLSELGDQGLTDVGYDAVKRMNKTGVVIDASHAGDRTAMETVEASDKPLLISHVGSRTLTNNARMLPDEVLQACAEKGGVVGVEVAGFAPRTEKHPEASIECLLEHAEYLIDLLGVDHVGAGPDTLWGDHAGLYRGGPIGTVVRRPGTGHYSRPRSPELSEVFDTGEMVRDLDHVKGLESPSDFVNIARGLLRDGYSDGEIAKVMGLNGFRVIEACWPK
ncbi:MAG: dipeptidase [Candidatus Bathyarchaeota archaeon]|nr:dipeptidase [Candidatus Bathyarchaeota archaeon]